MQSYILRESVLNDDTLYLPDNGKVFKGGYIAIVDVFTFKNAWSNTKSSVKFRSKNRLLNYLKKNYNEALEELDINLLKTKAI